MDRRSTPLWERLLWYIETHPIVEEPDLIYVPVGLIAWVYSPLWVSLLFGLEKLTASGVAMVYLVPLMLVVAYWELKWLGNQD